MRIITQTCAALGRIPGTFIREYSTHPADASAGSSLMSLSSNKAMRYVYLRTLPLAKEPLITDVDKVASSIESGTERLCTKHALRAVDDRAAVHLHMAALAISSFRVLYAVLRDEDKVCGMIRRGFGAEEEERESMLPGYWLTRFALWFAWDKMAAVRRMATNMANDFGKSFEIEEKSTPDGSEHRLVVSKW